MEKAAEEHILTKRSKYNIFQIIRDLVHDFMNINALKTRKMFLLTKTKWP